MNHEYRERDDLPGICAGCGRAWMACEGQLNMTAGQIARKFQQSPGLDPLLQPFTWEDWCARHGIDPNTPDERLLDDYLHGRAPAVRVTRRERSEVAELERMFRL